MAIESEHKPRLGVEIKKKLRGFDLEIAFEAGVGCLGILGPSGCGKSMTLKSIAGIVTPDSGWIALQYAMGEAAGGRVLYDSSLKMNLRPQERRVEMCIRDSEEIERICMEAVKLGIRHIKVTGGEPLVRKGCPQLIGRLRAIPGIEAVTITTNGILLERYLEDLKRAGVDGINVSLDTLDRDKYRELTGFDCLEEVLSGCLLYTSVYQVFL